MVRYPGVFPDVDLLYWLGNTHFEEALLLRNKGGSASYTFTYRVPGATAHQDAAGTVHLLDKQGRELLAIGGVAMYEADNAGQPRGGAGTDAVKVTLSGTGPDHAVTLTPDAAWLADPTRRFPVAIDPSWSGADSNGGGTSGNMYADTFDEHDNPTWNFNTTNSERIGNCDLISSSGTGWGTGVNRSYLKFPVGAAPFANLRVTSATLELYQTEAYGGSVPVTVNAITSAWDATTLTWNNHPTGFVYGGRRQLARHLQRLGDPGRHAGRVRLVARRPRDQRAGGPE
jgi:hypothetical protein